MIYRYGLPPARLNVLFKIKNRTPTGAYWDIPKRLPAIVQRLVDDGLITTKYELTDRGREITDFALMPKKDRRGKVP